jgi:hypothetical protein
MRSVWSERNGQPFELWGEPPPGRDERELPPHTGVLVLRGTSGAREQLVEIVGEYRQYYIIRAIVRTRLAGRARHLAIGDTTRVPKRAIRLEP